MAKPDKDVMYVNSSLFEGSGVGEGYYDEYEERRIRKKEARLPKAIMVAIVAVLAFNTYLIRYEQLHDFIIGIYVVFGVLFIH